MKQQILHTLHTLKDNFGESIFTHPAQFRSALADVQIDNDAIRNLLKIAICDLNVITKIQTSGDNNTCDELVQDLTSKYMINHAVSKVVIESICEFLGIKKTYDDVFQVVKDASVTAVKQYIKEHNVDITIKDEDDWTLIYHAAHENPDVDVLKYLVSIGANITEKSRSGKTPLHFAAQNNQNKDVFDYLISQGLQINEKNDKGITPLIDAVRWNTNIQIVKHLVSLGADKHVIGEKGWTVLHYAIGNPNPDIVKYFINEGVDINAKDENFSTPLHVMITIGENLEILKTLIFHGADLQIKMYGNDGMSSFTAYDLTYLNGVPLAEEKRQILQSAKSVEKNIGSFEAELAKIEKEIIAFEDKIKDGSYSVENNKKRILSIGTDETWQQKIQEKDFAWVEKQKKEINDITGNNKTYLMNDLIELKRKYPNEDKVKKLGKRGIKLFQKVSDIWNEVVRISNGDPRAIDMYKNDLNFWTETFGYPDE